MDFLRLKQAGIHNDLTDLLSNTDLYVHDEIARYGLPGKITALAYDPVQSLLALGTGSTLDNAKVYVFGQGRVEVIFELARKCNVNEIQFCAGRKLVVWDSSSEITVIGLEEEKVLTSYSPPGAVTALATDPSLDWAFLGLDNGDVLCYDVDREMLAPFRIKSNRKYGPRGRVSPVTSLSIHPRDISRILVGYRDAAAIFQFNSVKSDFLRDLVLVLEPGAPGGDTDPSLVRSLRKPLLSTALWSPTGLFILTTHEDGCLAFWDPNNGTLIQARTVQDGDVHKPQGIPGYGAQGGTYPAREPFFQVGWVSGENPEDTALLVSGGGYSGSSGITILEYGVNPSTITSSYQTLSDYFASPKKHRVFPTPPHNPVIKFLPLPRDNPHYSRSHNPHALICLLSDSSLTTLAYPSALPIPGSLYHPSISLHHPKVDFFHVTAIARPRWITMKPLPAREPFIQGGAELPHERRRNESRLLAQSVHNEDGKIRVWDLGRKDETENNVIIEVDVFAACGRGGVRVEKVDMSSGMGELAAALDTGEIVIWRWDRNRKLEPPEEIEGAPKPVISDIRYRANPGIRESLLPAFLVDERRNSRIVLLEFSSVGFLVVGYADGTLTIVDLRQPRIMLSTNLSSGGKPKRSSILKSSSAPTTEEVVTATRFSVFILDEAEFTSLNLHISTSHGRLHTYRIIPREGVYHAEHVGTLSLSTSVHTITAIEPYRGKSVRANPDSVAALRDGIKTDGCLVTFAQDEVRVCKPPTNKGGKEVFDRARCIAGNVAELADHGVVAVCVMDTGELQALSLPNLKTIHKFDLTSLGFDPRRLPEIYVSESGDIIGWLLDGRLSGINLWGEGDRLHKAKPSLLINPSLALPPRPTISNLQWLSGTAHLTPDTLADLIFPGRPQPVRGPQPPPPGPGNLSRSATQGSQAGVWENMQKSLEERTKNLNLVGDSMDRLGESAQSFTQEVDRFVKDAKKKALWGGIKGKFL